MESNYNFFLAKDHFREQLNDVLNKKILRCPREKCKENKFRKYQDLRRHYIGGNHGVVEHWLWAALLHKYAPPETNLESRRNQMVETLVGEVQGVHFKNEDDIRIKRRRLEDSAPKIGKF